MNNTKCTILSNPGMTALADINRLDMADFRSGVLGELARGSRIMSLFASATAADEALLIAIMGHGASGKLRVYATELPESYPALTPDAPQAEHFERELCEQYAVAPVGHPWPEPVRFAPPLRGDARDSAKAPGDAAFMQAAGPEIHEVAVGPVHAGIIEPGHFRFHCHGEKILNLEIALGYQHRGVERALLSGPDKRALHYMETLAGDTTIGHATAYCQACEQLSRTKVSVRAQIIRGIALELERLANHTGDLGALANDVGYQPTSAYCGRLRGDFLNLSAMICGNRFGRRLVVPGGTAYDLDDDLRARMTDRITQIFDQVANAVGLLWKTTSVLARFEDTGIISRGQCLNLGLVGPAARACGVMRDARYDFPSGIYTLAQIPVSTWPTGDVFARAYVRWLEIQRSVRFICDLLQNMPAGNIGNNPGQNAPNSLAVSVVEGWRGEICHAAITDDAGHFRRYKVVDPSFHNWIGLKMAVRGEAIMDFPLCNKSFNLSYCGHDL